MKRDCLKNSRNEQTSEFNWIDVDSGGLWKMAVRNLTCGLFKICMRVGL